MDMLRPPLPGVGEVEDPADDADELEGDGVLPFDPASGLMTAPPGEDAVVDEPGDAPGEPPLRPS